LEIEKIIFHWNCSSRGDSDWWECYYKQFN